MKFKRVCLSLLLLSGFTVLSQAQTLQVCTPNPRYFCRAGVPVLLTGSHTWNDLYDLGPTNPPAVANFAAYLDFMAAHNHNFLRLWAAEQTRWWGKYVSGPHVYARTGPGNACDGQLKFDLSQFDQAYFDRLRTRVIDAGSRGITTSVMLFMPDNYAESAYWCTHPFSASANINGVNGDINGDGKGFEVATLQSTEIFALHQNYIRKVVDTVNDLDNVLYEVGNEANPGSTTNQWQYAVLDEIHAYEATLSKQHPAGMTSPYPFNNAALDASPADWVSPGSTGYGNAPPTASGAKVVILDSDHVSPTFSYGSIWPWKAFLKGSNPIRMDPYGGLVGFTPRAEDAPFRFAMGDTLTYSRRLNLLSVTPQNAWASSGYCLCSSADYLVLAFGSKRARASVNVTVATGTFSVEWFDPASRQTAIGPKVNGGGSRAFTSPFGNNVPAVLFLKLDGASPPPPPPSLPPPPTNPPTALKSVTDFMGNVWEMWPATPYNNVFLNGSYFAHGTDLVLGSDGVAYSKGTTDSFWWWWNFSSRSWQHVNVVA